MCRRHVSRGLMTHPSECDATCLEGSSSIKSLCSQNPGVNVEQPNVGMTYHEINIHIHIHPLTKETLAARVAALLCSPTGWFGRHWPIKWPFGHHSWLNLPLGSLERFCIGLANTEVVPVMGERTAILGVIGLSRNGLTCCQTKSPENLQTRF